MRPTTALLLIIIITGFGCTKAPSNLEQRMVALEERVDFFGQMVETQGSIMTNLLQLVRGQETKTEELAKIGVTNLMMLRDFRRESSEALQDHIDDTNPHPIARAAALKGPAARSAAKMPASALIQGIPSSTYNRIKADAEKEWPGDYQMQSFTIRNQVEAYKKVNQ